MKRKITFIIILACIALDLKIGLLRQYDYEYYLGVQIIEVLLFTALALNTIGWNHIISILIAILCTIKGYDIYRKHGEAFQWSDLFILATAGAWILFVYINHKRKQNVNR